MPDREEVVQRLARIKRLIAELESECGRSASLRDNFKELQQQITALVKPFNANES